jgi:hypothetical protein
MGIGMVQVSIVAFWLKLRKPQLDFFNDAFGWGDVLILFVVAFYLMPMQYLVFIIISCLLSIVYAFGVRWLFKKEGFTIPLAGIMAILLIAYQNLLYFTDTLNL